MKLLFIANLIYVPIANTNKYIAGSISGLLFIDQILTLEEIKAKHPVKAGASYNLQECEDLHDMCKKWGPKN